MEALRGLARLLLAQSAGEALVRLARAVPAVPVLGLLLMLVALRFEAVRAGGAAADVPRAPVAAVRAGGVGVMTHAGCSRYGSRMPLVIVISTWVAAWR